MEGLTKGRKEGLDEGRTQERQVSHARERRLLLHLLHQRFGDDVDVAIEERVEAASAEQVETWLDHVVSAATLAEVLAH